MQKSGRHDHVIEKICLLPMRLLITVVASASCSIDDPVCAAFCGCDFLTREVFCQVLMSWNQPSKVKASEPAQWQNAYAMMLQVYAMLAAPF